MSVNPYAPPPFAAFVPASSLITAVPNGASTALAPDSRLAPGPPPNGSFDFIPIIETGLNQSAPQYPVNTVAPVVSGSTVEPATLTTTNGTWTNSPTGYAYQWYSGGLAVGTNQNTYTTGVSDVGNLVYCSVTASNTHGGRLANSNTVGPITSGAVTSVVSAVLYHSLIMG